MSAAPGRRWRLIALDDEEAQRRLLGLVFAGGPFALTVATSGQEMLDLARQQAPDLVLLDIRMPRMNGFEVLRRLRADPRTASVPAIAVTANAAPDDVRRMDAAGFSACVAKPYDVQELLHAVEVILLPQGDDHG